MGDAPPPKPKYVKVFKKHEAEIPDSFDINKFKQDYTNYFGIQGQIFI